MAALPEETVTWLQLVASAVPSRAEPETAGDHAHRLREEGLTLIPLGSRHEPAPRGISADQWPKRPRVPWTEYQATPPDDATFDAWRERWPLANWAILTGAQLVVVDADSTEAMAWIDAGHITRTPRTVTTAKGRHYWYRGDASIRNSAGKAKVDIRGAGGYVVAPGSVHASGVIYHEVNPADVPLDELPALTPADLQAIAVYNGAAAPVANGSGNLNFAAAPAPDYNGKAEGARNDNLARLAGECIARGMDKASTRAVLNDVNSRNKPPLAEREVETILQSVARTHERNHQVSVPEVGAHAHASVAVTNGTSAPVRRFARASELLADLTPPDWLLARTYARNRLYVVYGPPKQGKSALTLDQAIRIALGLPWGELRTDPGPVFILAGEGHDGIKLRLRAWELANGMSLADAPLFISSRGAQLMLVPDAQAIADEVQALATECGHQPAIVFIDTLARNFGPGDESKTQDMALFVGHCDRILREPTGAAVVIVHHTPISDHERPRGSGLLLGAADAAYGVAKQGAGQVRWLSSDQKDQGADLANFWDLVGQPVQNLDGSPLLDKFGEPVTAVVPRPAAAIEGLLARVNEPTGHHQQTALNALRILYREHQKNIDDSGIESTPRVLTSDWRAAFVEASGTRSDRKAWLRALDALVAQGFVTVEGPHSLLQQGDW